MLEAELQSNVRDLALVSGLIVYHTHDSRRSEKGFPDLVIVGTNAVLYRELKSADGRVTPEQEFWLAALRESGQDAAVWRPADWPDRICLEMGRLRRVRAERPLPRPAEGPRRVPGRPRGGAR